MPNTIPGVVLPGDAEYKNQFLQMPTSMLYGPHQSRIFWMKLLGRKFTIEDAEKMVKAANGTLTIDYVTPEYLEKQGVTGMVMPVVEANIPDERRTVYQWEEHQIDDNDEVTGTFTAAVATITAGTPYTFTVTSTAGLVAGGTILTEDNTQIRVNSVTSATQFVGEAAQNSFTEGASSIPGTDTAANGAAVANNDTYIILASAQEVGGGAVQESYNRPTIRRNAFQTIAVEFPKTGHAIAEDGSHATLTTTLKEREFQTWYRTYCKIDDTMWFGKYGRGLYGANNDKEVYYSEGLKQGIGNSKTITDFGSGTTLNIDKVDAIMAEVTQTNNPKNLFFFGDSTIGSALNKIGRDNSSLEVEPGQTDFGTSFLKVHTHRGTFKFFEMPTSKQFLNASGTSPMYALNMDYIKPVTRKGRTFKVERNRYKDQTLDEMFDVLRGDMSLMVCHKASQTEILGATG